VVGQKGPGTVQLHDRRDPDVPPIVSIMPNASARSVAAHQPGHRSPAIL